MSQKDSSETIERKLVEKDLHDYLDLLKRKLRNAQKKLEQIEELRKKEKRNLSADQRKLVDSKEQIIQDIKEMQSLNDAWDRHRIVFETKDIDGTEVKDIESTEAKVMENNEEIQCETEVTEKDKDLSKDKIVNDNELHVQDKIIQNTLEKILKLISFSQTFGNSFIREQFLKLYEEQEPVISKEEIPSFADLQEFYKSIFSFKESQDLNRLKDKISQSIEKLTHFVKAEEEPAFGDKTYKQLDDLIERATKASFFKSNAITFQVKPAIEKETITRPRTEEKKEDKIEEKTLNQEPGTERIIRIGKSENKENGDQEPTQKRNNNVLPLGNAPSNQEKSQILKLKLHGILSQSKQKTEEQKKIFESKLKSLRKI